MNVVELYKEWKSLKAESINFQRAGADGVDFDYERDAYVYDRIKQIENEMFQLLKDRETLIFNNTPLEDCDRQQDKFYTNNYLINWIKIKEDLKINNGLATGEIVYAKKPQI